MSRLSKVIITGLGTGYLPVAPGTWGSAATAGVYVAAALLLGRDAWALAGVMLAVAAVSSVACVAFGRGAERDFGRKDPRQCTIDEWAGQAVAFVGLPAAAGWSHALIVAGVAFVAFRVFDIIKPPPARAAERLPLGWGVLIDDLIAGVYANAAAQLVLRAWLAG
jgi:phosphatidylglycerophosphatase A